MLVFVAGVFCRVLVTEVPAVLVPGIFRTESHRRVRWHFRYLPDIFCEICGSSNTLQKTLTMMFFFFAAVSDRTWELGGSELHAQRYTEAWWFRTSCSMLH